MVATACAGSGAVSLGKAPGAKSSPPGPTSSGPHTSPRPTTNRTTPPSPTSNQTVTYQVWFAYGEHLFVTKRTETFSPGVGRMALDALLAGPTSAERAAGVGTIIPSGTAVRGLTIGGGIATVDLNSTYASGGGSFSERFRLAQVVYTLTQFPTVTGVNFKLDGKAVTTFSGEGIVLDHPQTRKDYDDLLPAILVESPLIGQRVSSPVTISGTANVFEATVSIRILDASGKEIASAFTQATCGTGCRGSYSTAVSYQVSSEQQGTIEVFESSAKDGSPINVVRIPVTLTP
jgi:hypothetical protein